MLILLLTSYQDWHQFLGLYIASRQLKRILCFDSSYIETAFYINPIYKRMRKKQLFHNFTKKSWEFSQLISHVLPDCGL